MANRDFLKTTAAVATIDGREIDRGPIETGTTARNGPTYPGNFRG